MRGRTVPVEMGSTAVTGVLAVLLVVAVGAAVRERQRHRGAGRRLASVCARLDRSAGVVDGNETMERTLARLERAADETAVHVADAVHSTERLAAVLRTVGEGVVVCDEHGVVVYRNERAATLAGGRNGDVLAERAVVELLEKALDGEHSTKLIELFGPPRRVLNISAGPLDDGRRGLGAFALIDDISEIRRLEAVRRDFVANVSHELKTPVGAVGLLAETLSAETQTGEADLGIIRRLADRMQLEAARVARIIDDLLDLSRIEAEEAPQRESVPVHQVLADALDRVRAMAVHRGVTLTERESSQRLTVHGNRRQLVSAVHNLLENAIKYSDQGGTVEVSAAIAGRWVEIIVRDRGIGIPTRDLERIFERFYRVDRARARDTGGTGLGLAIVRHVVNSHGGDVRVESREGEGSSFTLRLPPGPGSMALVDAEAG